MHHDTVLTRLTTYCGNGSCPTVYRTDRGTYVVQGTPVDPAEVGIDLPEGESLVEVPAELLAPALGPLGDVREAA